MFSFLFSIFTSVKADTKQVPVVAYAAPPVYVDENGLPQAYVRLAEKGVSSKSYELANILSVPTDKFYFIPEHREVLIISDMTQKRSASKGDLLMRYTDEGELIGVLENHGQFRTVGANFKETGYNDWVVSGEKEDKPYVKIIDGDKLSVEELKTLVVSAENIDTSFAYEKDNTGVLTIYLKQKNGWSLLRTKKYFGLYDFDIAREQEYSGLPFKGMVRRSIDRLHLMKSSREWDLNTGSSPIKVMTFNIKGKRSPSFMDINNHGWEGGFGHGYLHLKHNNEDLHFQIELAQEKSNGPAPQFDADMEVIPIPLDYRHKNSVVFFILKKRPYAYRPGDEIGVYALRSKQRDTSKSKVQAYNHLYSTSIEVTNLQPPKGDWYSLFYFNGSHEHVGASMAKGVAVAPRPIPRGLSFNWEFSNRGHGVNKTIRVNDKFMSMSDAYFALIDLEFDLEEMSTAYRRLGDKEPITIWLDVENLDVGVVWRWLVKNSKTEIVLHKIRMSSFDRYGLSSDEYWLKEFALSKLNKLYQQALNDQLHFGEYINFANAMEEGYWIKNANKYASELAGLIHNRMLAKDWSSMDISYNLYMKRINSYVTDSFFSIKEYIVADMLFTENVKYKKSFFDRLWLDTLGGESNYHKIKDMRLLYNLACYHAVIKNKNEMLRMARRALELGKDPEIFFKESDFAAYWTDIDFIELVKRYPAAKPGDSPDIRAIPVEQQVF